MPSCAGEADVIIVGASRRVLLLEAGPDTAPSAVPDEPNSRGKVQLRRSGEGLEAHVDFNLLTEPTNSSRMAHGMQLALDLLRSPACAEAWQECFVFPPATPLQRPNRLRVDASVMPQLVRTNTNLPAIMFGERAAQRVRRERGVMA